MKYVRHEEAHDATMVVWLDGGVGFGAGRVGGHRRDRGLCPTLRARRRALSGAGAGRALGRPALRGRPAGPLGFGFAGPPRRLAGRGARHAGGDGRVAEPGRCLALDRAAAESGAALRTVGVSRRLDAHLDPCAASPGRPDLRARGAARAVGGSAGARGHGLAGGPAAAGFLRRRAGPVGPDAGDASGRRGAAHSVPDRFRGSARGVLPADGQARAHWLPVVSRRRPIRRDRVVVPLLPPGRASGRPLGG